MLKANNKIKDKEDSESSLLAFSTVVQFLCLDKVLQGAASHHKQSGLCPLAQYFVQFHKGD